MSEKPPQINTLSPEELEQFNNSYKVERAEDTANPEMGDTYYFTINGEDISMLKAPDGTWAYIIVGG